MPDGMTLKYFKPDDYHIVTGAREEFMTHEPDSLSAMCPFKAGDEVVAYEGTRSEIRGVITGFATEDNEPTPFARIGRHLYHVSQLRKI